MFKRQRGTETILEIETNKTMPPVESNMDYQRVLAWVAQGNTILDADSPPPTQEELDVQAVKDHPRIAAMKAMTPAQGRAWVQANVNTLADAKQLLEDIVAFLIVAVRRI